MRVKRNIVVIGGGAAGFFAATEIAVLQPEADVYLLEGSQRPLAKVLISGGGRCNVTHAMFDAGNLVKQYPRGYRELRGAFSRFQPEDTIEWFRSRGVALKTEADGRMFPTSNKSETIAHCLKESAKRAGVKLRLGWRVAKVIKKGEGFMVCPPKGDSLYADRLVLTTGSSPIGHKIAKSLGHTIIPAVPSLFTFQIKDPMIKDLMGIAFHLTDVKLNVAGEKFSGTGPILITHWGLSGPAILRLSAFAARALHKSSYQAELVVNWCPSHSVASMETTLLNLKHKQPNDPIAKFQILEAPKRFWLRQLQLSNILERQTFQEISLKNLRLLAKNLCAYTLKVSGKGVFKDEFVTAGGVDLREVDFRTMGSKKVAGLHFAGEVLDIDGVTGGFNFQNAWTTGWIAAQGID